MAYEQRDYAGGAVETTIVSGINATDLGITITSSTGWPTGGANGPFFVVVDKGLAGEEKIEIQSRTGTSLTVASAGKRGADGTTASTHAAGATIAHCLTAQDIQEANSHIANTGLDHHTQYLNAARHAATSHTQAMLAADSVGASQIQTNAVGSAELADNAVDAAAIAANAVTTAKILDSNVTTGKIADLNVTTAKIADLNVTSGKLANDAVTAGKIADGAVDVTASLANGIVTFAKLAFETSTNYDPDFATACNLILGTGGSQYGRYYQLGSIVVGIAGFKLGTGGNLPSGNQLAFELPFGSVDRSSGIDNHGWIVAGRASQGGATYSGLGVIADDNGYARAFVTAGSAAAWDALVPFNWADTGLFQAFFMYERVA